VELSVLQTIREKTKLLNRVRRIRGQVVAIERALEQEIGCADVLQLITAARGAVNGLIGDVIEDHIRIRLIDPMPQLTGGATDAAEELIGVLKSYLK
jgi:DNA-binding FrmR family transcriptional regulator